MLQRTAPAIKLTNGVASYLHRDHLGPNRAITDATGARVESAIYKPFGEQTEFAAPGLPAPETKGWIGERFDADAGLQYLGARYYDPVLGMFLQPDWFDVLKPGVGTNRFSYSFNDPVNKRDPMGNQTYQKRKDPIETNNLMKSLFGGGTGTSSPQRVESQTRELGAGIVKGFAAIPGQVSGAVKGSYEYVRTNTVSGGLILPDVGAAVRGDPLEIMGMFPTGKALSWGADAFRAGRRLLDSKVTTTLFRAVSAEEYNEVMQTGAFRMAVGSYEMGKQFGMSLDETLQFSNFARDTAGILRVEVPTKLLDGMADRTHVDPFIFRSGTVTIPAQSLPAFNTCIVCISDALE